MNKEKYNHSSEKALKLLQLQKVKDLYNSGYFHDLDDMFIPDPNAQLIPQEKEVEINLGFDVNPYERLPAGYLFDTPKGELCDKEILHSIDKNDITIDEVIESQKDTEPIIEEILSSILENNDDEQNCADQ